MAHGVSSIPPITLAARNRRVMLAAALIALASLGMGFAAVPLYRLFCQVTGFGGTTQRADGLDGIRPVLGKTLSIRFDSNVSHGLPWRFMPEQEVQTTTIGQKTMAIYTARNLSDKPVTGRAVFNVTPQQAGRYFTKIECFCFTQQTLQPGQEVRMPVIYYVDPAILRDKDNDGLQEITLSYTFYPVEKGV